MSQGIVEKTALAEAEIEYEDHKSITIYAKFLVKNSQLKELNDANIIIWTTTPWTIPGNRAVAYAKEIDYSLLHILKTEEGSIAKANQKIVIAKDLINSVLPDCKILEWN